jgi:Holliday junction resolvase RusA-like endonuclease
MKECISCNIKKEISQNRNITKEEIDNFIKRIKDAKFPPVYINMEEY